MSGIPVELTAKLLEIMAEAAIMKIDLRVAETKLAGAEERASLLLEAKNFWMDRALKAEAR